MYIPYVNVKSTMGISLVAHYVLYVTNSYLNVQDEKEMNFLANYFIERYHYSLLKRNKTCLFLKFVWYL